MLGGFRGGAKSRQIAISGRRGRRQFGEGRFGFGRLVLIGQPRRRLEGRTGHCGLLGLEILISAPAANGGNDQDSRGDDQRGIAVPNLLELLAAQLLINFTK